jgi:hypothetical protein
VARYLHIDKHEGLKSLYLSEAKRRQRRARRRVMRKPKPQGQLLEKLAANPDLLRHLHG